MAFPLVSAGVYGWSQDESVACALEAFHAHGDAGTSGVQEARIVAFGRSTYDLVRAAVDG